MLSVYGAGLLVGAVFLLVIPEGLNSVYGTTHAHGHAHDSKHGHSSMSQDGGATSITGGNFGNVTSLLGAFDYIINFSKSLFTSNNSTLVTAEPPLPVQLSKEITRAEMESIEDSSAFAAAMKHSTDHGARIAPAVSELVFGPDADIAGAVAEELAEDLTTMMHGGGEYFDGEYVAGVVNRNSKTQSHRQTKASPIARKPQFLAVPEGEDDEAVGETAHEAMASTTTTAHSATSGDEDLAGLVQSIQHRIDVANGTDPSELADDIIFQMIGQSDDSGKGQYVSLDRLRAIDSLLDRLIRKGNSQQGQNTSVPQVAPPPVQEQTLTPATTKNMTKQQAIVETRGAPLTDTWAEEGFEQVLFESTEGDSELGDLEHELAVLTGIKARLESDDPTLSLDSLSSLMEESDSPHPHTSPEYIEPTYYSSNADWASVYVGHSMVFGFIFMYIIDKLFMDGPGGHSHGDSHHDDDSDHAHLPPNGVISPRGRKLTAGAEEIRALRDDETESELSDAAIPTASALALKSIQTVALDGDKSDSLSASSLKASEGAPTTRSDAVSRQDARSDETSCMNTITQALFAAGTGSVGLLVHNAADGFAFGAASLDVHAGPRGFTLFLAIVLHKVPMALGVFSVLVGKRLPSSVIKTFLVVFSLAAPLSAILTSIVLTVLAERLGNGALDNGVVGLSILFSAGSLIYTVGTHVLPELQHHHLGKSRSRKVYAAALPTNYNEIVILILGVFTPMLFPLH